MNESVYSLIPPKQEQRAAPPMYRSKHRTLAPTCSTFGLQGTSRVVGNVAGEPETAPPVHPGVKPTGSFGKPVAHTVNPKDFLKKTHAANASQPKLGVTFSRSKPANPKPTIPLKEDRPVMGLKSDKNFVVANAVESVLAAPKHRTVTEDRAVNKETFGQVPGYLKRVKAELKAKTGNADAAMAASARPEDAYEVLDEQEVEQLRSQLHARREALNKQYQTLSFTLETDSQKKRKEALEKSLAEVEAMLQKLSKRRVVVVDN